MSMQFVTLRQQEESPGAVTVDQYWYLTEDKSRVVAEGDPAGRWLWASPGAEVSLRDAIRLGAVRAEPEPEVPPADPEPPSGETVDQDAKPDTKAAKPAANKAAKQVPNKAQAKGEDK